MQGSFVIAGATIVDGIKDDPYLGDIRVADGKIAEVSAKITPGPDDDVIAGQGLFVTPGLIDSHCHLIYNDVRNFYEMDLLKSLPEAAVDAVVSARSLLEQGFTTIRDLGSRGNIGVVMRDAIASGAVAGPRVLAAGTIISTVGGLIDAHPAHMFDGHSHPQGTGTMINGPWEARAAVRRQSKDQVDWIKTETSGTGFNPLCGGHTSTMSTEELQAIVEEARIRDLKVAVHAESRAGIARAIEVGVDTIEHGVFMDDESMEMLIDRGIALSPTLAIFTGVAEWGAEAGLPQDFVDSQKEVREVHIAMVRRAYEAKATIIAGSDGGLPGFAQGAALREIRSYVELAGFSPMDAIKSATSVPAKVLGLQGVIGSIEAGCSADLVVYRADPIANVAIMDDPASRVAVIKEGIVAAGELPRSNLVSA